MFFYLIFVSVQIEKLQWGGGGGGGTLIFSYICRLGYFFFGRVGSKFCFSIFLGGFRKMNIFGGMKILWIFFRVITKWD